MGSRKDFLSAMGNGKANATRDRNKGFHVGKVAKGWNRQRHHDPKLRTANMLIEAWRVERDAIINRYRLFAFEPDFDWENFK